MTTDFFDLQRQNHSFESPCLFDAAKLNVAADGRAAPPWVERVTSHYFGT
jgi:hypothetical protein